MQFNNPGNKEFGVKYNVGTSSPFVESFSGQIIAPGNLEFIITDPAFGSTQITTDSGVYLTTDG